MRSVGYGIYIILRMAKDERGAVGVVLKLKRDMLFSERHTDQWKHSFTVGPFYFRTYARRR